MHVQRKFVQTHLIYFGHFLFSYRDYLFPLVFLSLLLATKPAALLGSPRLDPWMACLGIAVALLGQGCRILAVGSGTNIRRGGRQKRVTADTLIQRGLFAHTRNPLYLGNLFIICGLLLIANCEWWYALVLPGFIGVYWAIVLAEEDFLTRKFGQEYLAYCQQVSRFVPTLPGLLHSLAACPFDWAQVLKKERRITCSWVSLAALLLLWKRWERFGVVGENAGVAVISLLIGLCFAAGGAKWWEKFGKG